MTLKKLLIISKMTECLEQSFEQLIDINEPWSDKNEKLIETWIGLCENKIGFHDRQGKYFKWKHQLYGLPAILIPVVVSPLVLIINTSAYNKEIISTSSLIATGVFNGVHRFFGFQEKSFRHFEYAAKYSELKTFMEVELSKQRKFRFDCDRFIEICQSRIDKFNEHEPV